MSSLTWEDTKIKVRIRSGLWKEVTLVKLQVHKLALMTMLTQDIRDTMVMVMVMVMMSSTKIMEIRNKKLVQKI